MFQERFFAELPPDPQSDAAGDADLLVDGTPELVSRI